MYIENRCFATNQSKSQKKHIPFSGPKKCVKKCPLLWKNDEKMYEILCCKTYLKLGCGVI